MGRNEVGPQSDPYSPPYSWNWSLPETFNFNVQHGDYLYIVAWNDGGAYKGLLGQLLINGRLVFTNKAPEWQIDFSYIRLNDFSPAPTEPELLMQVADAEWQPVPSSLPHGSQPHATWQPGGIVPGISIDAQWIWGTPMDMETEGSETEYHIYRYPVLMPPTACESELADVQAEIAKLTEQLEAAQGEIATLNAELLKTQGQLNNLEAALAGLMTSVQNDLRSSFMDANFVLPDGSPLAQLENLVAAITSLQRGSKLQVYKGLGGKPGKK